jgi:hypothetical protein
MISARVLEEVVAGGQLDGAMVWEGLLEALQPR